VDDPSPKVNVILIHYGELIYVIAGLPLEVKDVARHAAVMRLLMLRSL
jgi:hypothetical protein